MKPIYDFQLEVSNRADEVLDGGANEEIERRLEALERAITALRAALKERGQGT